MRDIPGDKAKQPQDCKEDTSCPNLQETSSPTDMNGETYNCEVCGLHFRLYYEDMA
jgi:hypothetical protein